MADDPLSAALAEVRDRNEGRIKAMLYTEYTAEHDVAEGDVRRLLAALDAVLEIAKGGRYLTTHMEDGQPVRAWVLDRDTVRAAILAELTGEANGG